MQGKKYLLAVATGFVSLALSGIACAELSAPDGWYVEGNVGSSKSSNTPYGGDNSNTGVGGSVNIGYKFIPYLAGEMGYSAYSNGDIKDDSTGTKAATIKNYSYDLAARGILPVSGSGFEVFAKLGVGRNNSHLSINNQAAATSLGISSTQHSATGIYIGAGAQYYFMPEMAAVVQWARQEGNNSTGNFDLITGGVSFLFS